MGKVAPKKGKGGKRKIGRASRKPSHNRYVVENRREKNKARKAARIEKELARKEARKERKG